MLTNRPVIVTQSDLLSPLPLPLQQRGSPYSSRCAALQAAQRAATQASDTNALLDCMAKHACSKEPGDDAGENDADYEK